MRRRTWLVALGLVTLFFLLARPVCEAAVASGSTWHSALAVALGHDAVGHGSQDDDGTSTCCASVAGKALVKAFEPWAQAAGGERPAAVLVVLFLVAIPVLPRAAAIRRRADPRSLPYHARSARILR